MRSLLAIILATTITFFTYSIGKAQKANRAPYSVLVNTKTGVKIFGKITAINDSVMLVADKKNIMQSIKYSEMKKIRVYKYRSDIGYTSITGALALGTIAAAQSLDESATSLAVGIGATLAVVTLSALLHDTFHGPELKMDAAKDVIEFPSVSRKMSQYIVTEQSLRP